MNLPQNEQLNISALSRSFSDMSESYKLFWFSGIMEIVKEGRASASFREIISNMVTSAWYMVSEYHLNLGPADTLEKLVLYAKKESSLKSSSKPEDIKAYINTADDSVITEYLKVLTLNVPYRLQAPFMPDFKGNDAWKSRQKVLGRINGDANLIYSFGEYKGLDTEIRINPNWQKYLFENQAIITGWIEYNMIMYLQKRNPSVPGIASKLYPPQERKLEAAKIYWKRLSEVKPIINIYGDGKELLSRTDISLDHFVPWSYVAHDELWNLVPTTKSQNSSKSDNLPEWNKYFKRLCEVQYLAYQTIWSNAEIYALFEKCKKNHINSDDVALKLYSNGIKKEEYCKRLEEQILPAYNAAKNLGFAQWKNE